MQTRSNLSLLPTLQNQLALVSLDNVYRTLEEASVQRFFMGMLVLKARGYAPPNYPSSYLTFDAADFVGRHHLICRRSENGLEPIAAFKNITLERCDFYKISPPYFGLLSSAEAVRHQETMSRLFEHHRSSSKPLFFSSGFTMSAEYRGTAVSTLIKELVASLMLQDSIEAGFAPMIGAGVPRFKTEKLWDQIGYARMGDKEGPLPPFPLLPSNNEPIVLMKVDEFSAWAKECHSKHARLLQEREMIRTPAERKVAA